MVGVVHYRFRSEDSGTIGARNSAEHMSNLDFQECGDTGLQRTGLECGDARLPEAWM